MKRPDETGSYLLLLYELYSQQEKRNDVRKRHNKLFLSFSFVLPIMCFVKLSVSYALLFFNCINKLLSKEIVDRRGYSLKFGEWGFI